MKDSILEFVSDYPIAWIPILLLVPFVAARKYRRWKRNTASADDATSKMLLGVGLVVTFIIIGLWLRNS